MTDNSEATYHVPVLVDEVVQCFAQVPSGWVADVTLGGGGHSEALLSMRTDLSVLGLDRDAEAIVSARARLQRFGDRVALEKARFSELAQVVAALHRRSEATQTERVSGILADLGVSSHHFDTPERGFSLRTRGELDMRMDRDSGDLTAAEIVNSYDEATLVRLFRDNGEARLARRFARAIIAARPILYTDELATLIEASTPAPARRGKIHPATRVFQALRLETNQEATELEALLDAALRVVDVNGVVAVISYHSGEDAVVKRFFRSASTVACHCPPGLPCVGHPEPRGELVFRGSLTPSSEEISANPRARSARLRALRIKVPLSLSIRTDL
jgi:16S rRNA (cytosine1402-N4)-methyltransferase